MHEICYKLKCSLSQRHAWSHNEFRGEHKTETGGTDGAQGFLEVAVLQLCLEGMVVTTGGVNKRCGKHSKQRKNSRSFT